METWSKVWESSLFYHHHSAGLVTWDINRTNTSETLFTTSSKAEGEWRHLSDTEENTLCNSSHPAFKNCFSRGFLVTGIICIHEGAVSKQSVWLKCATAVQLWLSLSGCFLLYIPIGWSTTKAEFGTEWFTEVISNIDLTQKILSVEMFPISSEY